MRVDDPQDVVHTVCCAPSASRYWMPNTLAKFCPNSWLVPICSALPSPIIASHVRLFTAPANRSFVVFSPTTTGIASTLTMKSS